MIVTTLENMQLDGDSMAMDMRATLDDIQQAISALSEQMGQIVIE